MSPAGVWGSLRESWVSLCRLAGLFGGQPGLHTVFLSHGIESLTLQWPKGSSSAVGQLLTVLETSVRSLSNMEERLHHATTLYWPVANGSIVSVAVLYAIALFSLVGLALELNFCDVNHPLGLLVHLLSQAIALPLTSFHGNALQSLEICLVLWTVFFWLVPQSTAITWWNKSRNETKSPPFVPSPAVGLTFAAVCFLFNPSLSCLIALGHLACAKCWRPLCFLFPLLGFFASGPSSAFLGAFLMAVCLCRFL